MTEPRRLLDDPETSPLAQQLLRSAQADGPSDHRRAAIAAALGLGTVSAAKAAGSAVASSTLGTWSMTLLLALGAGLGGLMAQGGPSFAPRLESPAAELGASSSARPLAAPSQAAARPSATVPSAPTAPPAPARVTDRLPTPAAPPTSSRANHAALRRERAAPLATASVPPAAAPLTAEEVRRLAAEVALIDRARTLLLAGDLPAASTALAGHARDFPGGLLTAEAEILSIDLLIRTHQPAAALRHAAAFLQRYPTSPLVKRARALRDEASAASEASEASAATPAPAPAAAPPASPLEPR